MIRLACWRCGKTKETAGPRPEFGFELAALAVAEFWVAATDCRRGRVLVFCSRPCLDACKTKDGHMRLRPPKEGSDGD